MLVIYDSNILLVNRLTLSSHHASAMARWQVVCSFTNSTASAATVRNALRCRPSWEEWVTM